MRRLKKMIRSTTSRLEQRGSALLASLMVIVGLSLLGLAFVTISETESAISINERNHSQTVAVAEAAARLGVQWFQDPDTMLSLNLMPGNCTAPCATKTNRLAGTYTGYYKTDPTKKLFDLPFGPLDDDKFFGNEDNADITINGATAGAFLTSLNSNLLGPEPPGQARPAGEITEIRIYAPPIVGATLNANGFYEGGTRYGVATIMARAEKFDRPEAQAGRRSLARAECRIVVSQFPLPAPAGPLQSATGLATNGNFNVHWGMVSAQQTLDLKKDYTTIPWFNAYERIHFNRGYDSSYEWAPNLTVRLDDVVRPTAAQIAGNAALRLHEYVVMSTTPASGVSTTATPPTVSWQTTSGAIFTQTVGANTITFKERTPTAYPLSTGGSANQSNTPWLNFIARGNISVADPWFQARSAQDILGSGTTNPQPTIFPFGNPNAILATCCSGMPTTPTHRFQYQSFDQYALYKELLFPNINYDFWKAAALAGNNQSGVKYLEYAGTAGMYTDGLTTKDFRSWASSQPGFYFFDTMNKQNPQNGGPGILAPKISINGGGTSMGSFIYLNAPFGTTGLSGPGAPTGLYNQPGEPYMDIGYRQVDELSATGDFKRDAGGMPIIQGAVNNQWDFQDLSWSNTGSIGGGTKNGKFDVYIASKIVHDPADTGNPTSTYTGWFPVPYQPGCRPGNNSCPVCNCSEPHEPYLNLKYNAPTASPFTAVTIGWYDPSTPVTTRRQPKKTLNGKRQGGAITCTASSSTTDCTGNGYDLDGALAPLDPATDGVLYTEGQFDSTGNADYYGSVLVGGGVNVKGTPNVWYDESLSRGLRLPGFPRVMATSVETDR